MAKTGAERQKAYEQRKLEAGWKRVPVWIPEEKIKDLKAFVEELKKSC
jgi:hypothetical protein